MSDHSAENRGEAKAGGILNKLLFIFVMILALSVSAIIGMLTMMGLGMRGTSVSPIEFYGTVVPVILIISCLLIVPSHFLNRSHEKEGGSIKNQKSFVTKVLRMAFFLLIGVVIGAMENGFSY